MSHDLDTGRSHAPRRRPTTPNPPVKLDAIAAELLAQARTMSAGRAARTLTPGRGAALTQTVLALTGGSSLKEHVAPGPATIQVLSGQVRLGSPAGAIELAAGQWAPIPRGPHDVAADGDAALVLTVAPVPDGPSTRESDDV